MSIVIVALSGAPTVPLGTPNTEPIVAILAPSAAAPDPGPGTPTDAAESLYFAWQRADRVVAGRSAGSQAVTAMFAIKTSVAAGLAFEGCRAPVTGSSTCTWARTGVRLTMVVAAPDHGVPRVLTVTLR